MWEEEDEIGEDDPLKYCLNPKLVQVERVVQIGEDLFDDEEEDEDSEGDMDEGGDSEGVEGEADDIFDVKAATTSSSSTATEGDDAEAEGRSPIMKRILRKLNRGPLAHQVR